jgi:putative ABC transport system permease protein
LDEVEILGKKFTLVGLSEGTASLVNSVAFISLNDFASLRGSQDTVSFLLVKIEPGESPVDIAALIEAQVSQVTAETTTDFAANEKRVVKDMSTDVITIMNLVGFLIGLAVMALTVYTATLARLKEFGVLKAIGAKNNDLYRAVMAQAFLSIILGFSAGLLFTLLLSRLIPLLGINLVLVVSVSSLIKVGFVSLVIASFSAFLPIRQIAGLDPAMVFRGK